VDVRIDPDAAGHPFSYWDAASGSWQIASGRYRVFVGTSSRQLQEAPAVEVSVP
jgi:beta-glucosidase